MAMTDLPDSEVTINSHVLLVEANVPLKINVTGFV
jgi:hypothetical protein